MYNVYRDGTEKLIGRYCGMTAPGPLDSNRGATGLKVLLHSDQEGVFSGFKARYSFEIAKSIFGGKIPYIVYIFNFCNYYAYTKCVIIVICLVKLWTEH